jgi:hypothetical protein
MLTLKNAISIVEIIVAVAVVLLLGDYLGYRIGRWKLASIVGLIVLISIVGFTVYAAVALL